MAIAVGQWAAARLVLLVVACLALGCSASDSPSGRPAQVNEFDPARYEGEMGKIVLTYKGESALLVHNAAGGKLLRLSTRDGTLLAPVGSYTLVAHEARATDEKGVEWTATAYLMGRRSPTVTVAVGTPVQLEVGPPLKASVHVRGGDLGNLLLDLRLLGRGGDQYVISGKRGSRETQRFKIIGPSGDVVAQGKFEYG